MKEAYATILSSEEFTLGLLVMYRSLRRFSSKEFVVFLSENISTETEEKLRSQGITPIREVGPEFAAGVISEKQAADRWNKTLFKLVVFKNHGYDKLVYLDSDLLIRDCIDELFDSPEWSAVADKEFYPEYGRNGLNAGVMVIEPCDSSFKNLVIEVDKVAKALSVFGDQDIINSFNSEWDETLSLHLNATYNACFYSDKKHSSPKVVHFILESKPWMWSKKDRFIKKCKWCVSGKLERIHYLREYEKLLRDSV